MPYSSVCIILRPGVDLGKFGHLSSNLFAGHKNSSKILPLWFLKFFFLPLLKLTPLVDELYPSFPDNNFKKIIKAMIVLAVKIVDRSVLQHSIFSAHPLIHVALSLLQLLSPSVPFPFTFWWWAKYWANNCRNVP